MSISRFLIENEFSNYKNIELAFFQAFKICQLSGLSNITLVFPVKRQFKSSSIANFLGDQLSSNLSKEGVVILPNGLTLSLETPNKINALQKHDVLLATYLTERDMDIVDEVNDAHSIVYLPWNEGEGKRWLSTWAPQVIGDKSWVAPIDHLAPLAQQAVLKLGHSINMATGLKHPSDKELAKKIFADLRKKGISFSLAELKRFAIHNGWKSTAAQELADFASKYIG